MSEKPRLLYCHCAYAQIVPAEVKTAVLRQLCASGASFESVADLCEMSARQDPALKRLADSGPVKIAACYPRAVKWLFASAKAPLPPRETQVVNMRVLAAEDAAKAMFQPGLEPNLPAAKDTEAQPAKPEARSQPSIPSHPLSHES